MRDFVFQVPGKAVLKFAAAYGFRNIQNLVQRIKRGRCQYHFVEVMACPSGQSRGWYKCGYGRDMIGGEGFMQGDCKHLVCISVESPLVEDILVMESRQHTVLEKSEHHAAFFIDFPAMSAQVFLVRQHSLLPTCLVCGGVYVAAV